MEREVPTGSGESVEALVTELPELVLAEAVEVSPVEVIGFELELLKLREVPLLECRESPCGERFLIDVESRVEEGRRRGVVKPPRLPGRSRRVGPGRGQRVPLAFEFHLQAAGVDLMVRRQHERQARSVRDVFRRERIPRLGAVVVHLPGDLADERELEEIPQRAAEPAGQVLAPASHALDDVFFAGDVKLVIELDGQERSFDAQVELAVIMPASRAIWVRAA